MRGALEATLAGRRATGRAPDAASVNEYQKQRLDMAHLGNNNMNTRGLENDFCAHVRALRQTWNENPEGLDEDVVSFPSTAYRCVCPFLSEVETKDALVDAVSRARALGERRRVANARRARRWLPLQRGQRGRRQAPAPPDGVSAGFRAPARARACRAKTTSRRRACSSPEQVSPVSRTCVYDRMKSLDE